jgi:PhnB protein
LRTVLDTNVRVSIMPNTAKPVPDGYHGATPYLCIKDAARGIEFYKSAFGATETLRIDAPGGKIGHAEIRIGEAVLMIADEYPEMKFVSPGTLGGTPLLIHLYVPDVDAFVQRAVAAGAKLVRPVADQFYGDRGGQLEDPFGHVWFVATHVEDVPADELKRRAAEMHGGQ